MDFDKPPSLITSDGYKSKVNSVRIFVSKGDPRKAENNWFGFGVYDMQFFYYRHTGLWWDTHSKTDHNLTGLQVFERLKSGLSKKSGMYVGIALELQLSSADEGLMRAAVQDKNVQVDTWKNVPFKWSKNEMQVLAVYNPREVASLLEKPAAEHPAVAAKVPAAKLPVNVTKPKTPPKVAAKPEIQRKPSKHETPRKPYKPAVAKFDPSRPCDSRSRAPNRYTRAELEALALAHDIDPKGKNMSQICSALARKK